MEKYIKLLNLINSEGLQGTFYSTLVAFLLLGMSVIIFLYLKFKKDLFRYKVQEYKLVFGRFFNNLFQMLPIIIALLILYFLFSVFNYSQNMAPELIGAGISVIFISFILNEKEYKEKEKLVVLLENKIKRIYERSRKLILNYIDFNQYTDNEITRDLLINILSKKNLLQDTIRVIITDNNGKTSPENIPMIDYPYYIGKELKPIVEEVINYASYLDYDKLIAIVQLEEILNKRIFLTRVSLIDGINVEKCKQFFEPLVDSIIEIHSILNKIEK